MRNFKRYKSLINSMMFTIVIVFLTVWAIDPAYGQKHKIADYKAESWDMVMSELHEHVEELGDFVKKGDMKEIEAVIPEVIEHAEEMIEASQKEHNKDGVKYGEKIKQTAPAILKAAQAGNAGKIKVRLNDINKYIHKIMASNPSWMIDEMQVHIKEMRAALKNGDVDELKGIALETYGHMTDLSAYLKKQGKTTASKTSKDSRKYMKEVKKQKNVSSNISGFEKVLKKLAAQI